MFAITLEEWILRPGRNSIRKSRLPSQPTLTQAATLFCKGLNINLPDRPDSGDKKGPDARLGKVPLKSPRFMGVNLKLLLMI